MVFLFFTLVMWAIERWFPVFQVDIPFQLFIVVFLWIVSFITGSMSIYYFVREGTTLHAHKPQLTTILVTKGPYRHSRNPMYLTLSILLIAWAVFLSDLLALMLMPAFYAYMTRFQIIPEERALKEKFGDEYEKWAERTPRWL